MRIGLLALGELWGGAETHTVGIARTLKEHGHHATVTCLTTDSYGVYSGHCGDEVELAYQPTPKAAQYMTLRDWMRFFSGQKWDACVLVKGAFTAGDWTLDLAARFWFGNYLTIEHTLGPPIPVRTSRRHWRVLPGLGLWWYRDRIRNFARSLGPKRIVCVSDASRKRLEEYGFPGRKLVTVRNGIDVERFQRDPATAERWRRQYGIPSSALVFGAVGRFHPGKGYDIALAAFQQLLSRSPATCPWLVLVGEGAEESALKAQAHAIRPAGLAIILPYCERPWEPLSAIDVFLMPSLSESMPLALLEAMACGCCPIATAVGGIPEVLCRPELGWTVKAADADALAAAMIDAAARTRHQRAAMATLVREQVLANFNAAAQFEHLAGIIESGGAAIPEARRVEDLARRPS